MPAAKGWKRTRERKDKARKEQALQALNNIVEFDDKGNLLLTPPETLQTGNPSASLMPPQTTPDWGNQSKEKTLELLSSIVEVDGSGNPVIAPEYFSEAGKALVSLTPAIQGQRGRRFQKEVATLFQYEEPELNLLTQEKMYKRLSIAQRGIQIITFHTMQGGIGIKPPQALLESENVQLPGRLRDNMLFIRKWQRYIGFNEIMVKTVLYWIIKGNSYLEIVHDERYPWKVTELKAIPADQMRVIRDPTGEVLGYLQFPPNIQASFLTYDERTARQAVGTLGAVYFRPGDIIHLKFMPLESAPYGRSLLEAAKDPLAIQTGMLEDIGIILRNYAAPLLMFKVGTEQVPASPETITLMAQIITAQLAASSNIVTSSAVQGDVLAPGQGTMNLPEYYNQAVKGVIMALGVPPFVLGAEDVSEAAGKQQLEAFSRFIRVLRDQLQHTIEMRLFPLLVEGVPLDDRGIPVVMPEHLDWIPEVAWQPIETEEERRIRDQNDFRFGAISREEYRVTQGRDPEHMGQLVLEQDLDAQMTLAAMKTSLMGQRDNTGATPRGKDTTKKSDRDEEQPKAKQKVPDATRKDKAGQK